MKIDIQSTLTNALTGLQVGMSHARSAAGEVARLTTGSNDVRDAVKPLLELHKAEQEVAIANKVVQVENETLGRFVDETV